MAWLPDYDALERWQHSRKGKTPDFNALMRWKNSLEGETEIDRQARMAHVKSDDPDYDIKSGNFSISEIRRFFNRLVSRKKR